MKRLLTAIALTLVTCTILFAQTGHYTALAWTAPSGTVTGYNVYRSTTKGGEVAPPLASNIQATTYADTQVAPGNTYYYTITALDGVEESSPSAEVSAVFPPIPNSPTNATATPH